MSSAPPPRPEVATAAAAAVPPVSRLAIAALVLASIPCCPLFSLVGALLGTVSLARIRRADGGLRGEGLALAAMLVGSLLALGQLIALEQFRVHLAEDEVALVSEQVEAALSGTLTGPVGDDWVDGTGVTDAGLAAAAAAIRDRHGSIIGLDLAEGVDLGDARLGRRQWSAVISFASGDRLAVVETARSIRFGGGRFGLLPGNAIRLRSIIVAPESIDPIRLGRPWSAVDPSVTPTSTPASTPASPSTPAPDAEATGG